MPLLMLFLSLAALLSGPALFPFFHARRHLYRLLDGFIVIVISGIVLVEVLPEVIAHNAPGGILLLGLGLLGPTILERVFHRAARQVHRTALMIGVMGIIAHAFVDGVALFELPDAGSYRQSMLGLGIILHRIPVGLTLWWLLLPRYGKGIALAGLVVMMAGTVGGYYFGTEMGHLVMGDGALLFQAFVAGAILHVVIHRPHESHLPVTETPDIASRFFHRRAEGIGNLIGLIVVVGIVALDPHEGGHGELAAFYKETGRIFWGLALESAPALLLAYLIGGMMSSFLPSASIRWMQRGPALARSVKGVVVGLPLPICTCGVLPLYRTLIKRGAPPTAAMAFLIATPELGFDALLISIPLLGGDMTVVRLVAAGVIALVVGWVVGRWVERGASEAASVDTEEKAEAPASVRKRVRSGLAEGFGGLVDDTAPWILLGILIAALAQPLLGQGWLQQLPDGVEVLFFALLGLPIYVCASGATPIVAVMLINGISPGAALAFLLTGPATNVSTYGILTQVHNQKTALLFGLMTTGMAVALGMFVNLLQPYLTLLTAAELDLDHAGLLQQISLVLLLTIFATSLLRQGARAFVGEITSGFKLTPVHNHTEAATCGNDHCHCD